MNPRIALRSMPTMIKTRTSGAIDHCNIAAITMLVIAVTLAILLSPGPAWSALSAADRLGLHPVRWRCRSTMCRTGRDRSYARFRCY